jgi:hypothetical protein
MMVENKLKDELENYRRITRNLLEALGEESYDTLDILLSERQNVINSINDISYTKDEFQGICSEFEIVLLEDKLTQEMHKRRKEVKAAIEKFSKHKSVNKSYNNRFNVDAIYINKEF